MNTSHILKDIIRLIESSDFYNKIQVLNKEKATTETFYFVEDGVAHSIVKEDNKEVHTLQEPVLISKDEARTQLESIEDDSIVYIAGNSAEHILELH